METKKKQGNKANEDSNDSLYVNKGESMAKPDPDNNTLTEAIEVLNELPKDKMEILTNGMNLVLSQSYRGPIPPASEVIKYKNASPDAPDRIFKMAELEQSSRIRQKDKDIHNSFILKLLGQIYGLLVAILFGIGSIYLGLNGHDWLAGSLGGLTVISLVSVFVLSKLPKNN